MEKVEYGRAMGGSFWAFGGRLGGRRLVVLGVVVRALVREGF